MLKFEPVPEGQQTASGGTNSSGATQVNGKLKSKFYNVEIQGSFDQVQSILRSFERLQTLLLFKEFKSELSDDQGVVINPDTNKVTPAVFKKENQKVIPGGKPDIKTTFTLEALSPVTENDAQAQAKGNASQPAQKPQK